MLDRILPRQADNNYRGHRLAPWILGLVIVMKGAIGFGTMFNGRAAASGADGIPLDQFGEGGAAAFLSIFAALGLAQVVLHLVALVVLVRYRTLMSFMFVVLLVEHLARRLVFQVLPIERTGVPPGMFINMALVGLLMVGLLLSLWRRGD